jgi:hypothetical protein
VPASGGTHTRTESLGSGLSARKRNFCGRDEAAETVSLKFNWPFAENSFWHLRYARNPYKRAVGGQCLELAADNRLVGSSSPPSLRWRLIMAWLEVRVLSAPPRSLAQTEISRLVANSPELAGIRPHILSLRSVYWKSGAIWRLCLCLAKSHFPESETWFSASDARKCPLARPDMTMTSVSRISP